MIKVNFIDGNSGRWGFIETVAFTAPLSQPPLDGELILEVSVKTEIFDCADIGFQTVKRVAGPMNYGPIVENFGRFFIFGEDGRGISDAEKQTRPVRGPVYDFHSAYGSNKVDGLYQQGEKIRITINGKVWIQDTQNTQSRGIEEAFTLTTAPDKPAPIRGDEKKTGRFWTRPGLVAGNFPNPAFQPTGNLVGQPKTPKTAYTYTFTYEKCGPQNNWKGTTQTSTALEFALLLPGDGFEMPIGFGPREEGLLSALVDGLGKGTLQPLALNGSLAFQELSAVGGLAGKAASRLQSASDLEAFVLINLLGASGDPAAINPLIDALGRFESAAVAFLDHSVSGQSFALSDAIRASLATALRRMNPTLRVPADLSVGGRVSEWKRWIEANRSALHNPAAANELGSPLEPRR
ncbi:MAG: hypothetical protein AB1631_23920 [Acidobacteriota bacterium]